MPVNTPHPDYIEFSPKWKRCRDTFDGQDAVKAERTAYLPMLGGAVPSPKSNAVYEAYLYRATFFNAVAPTVVGLTGAAFMRPLSVENVPDFAKAALDDVTLNGHPLEQFARSLVGQVVSPGRAGVLVDMPANPSSETRPYWVIYRAEQIINWRGIVVNGQTITTMVVLLESAAEVDPADVFVMKPKRQYRVLQLVNGIYTVTIWTQNPEKADEYVAGTPIQPMRRGDPMDFIPFVFVGPEGTTERVSDPPLMALVDTNLAHYLTMADLKWGEHFTALPTPVITGTATDAEVHIGSSEALILTDPQAKAFFMEFTGEGLAALRTSEQETRKMMATLGGRVLSDTGEGAAETATEVKLKHSGGHASLTNIAQSCSQALSRAVAWTIWWRSTETKVPIDAKITLSTEFFPTKMSPDELAKLTAALQDGSISFETFFHNLQEGGVYAPGTTLEEERARIEKAAADALKKQQEVMKAMAGDPPEPEPDPAVNLPPIEDE